MVASLHLRPRNLKKLDLGIFSTIHLRSSIHSAHTFTKMSSTPPKDETFSLPATKHNPVVSVTIPSHLTHKLNQEMIENYPAFNLWRSTLVNSLSLQHSLPSHPFHAKPYTLRRVDIQSLDVFTNSKIGFLKFVASVTNDSGESLSGSVFMRGGSVAMLIILTPSTNPTTTVTSESEEYAILTIQPRIAAGSLSFVEIPAGMVDDGGTFAGTAAREIKEETGLEIHQDELLDLTALAADNDHPDQDSSEILQSATYPSPGGSDEHIPIFLARKTLPLQEIEALKGKLTGLRDEGEKITLKIVPLHRVWREAARDGKTLAALTLYRELKLEGKI